MICNGRCWRFQGHKESWNAVLRCGVFIKASWNAVLGVLSPEGRFFYGGCGHAFDIFVVGSGAIQGIAKGALYEAQEEEGKQSDGESDAAMDKGMHGTKTRSKKEERKRRDGESDAAEGVHGTKTQSESSVRRLS